ncbi:DUF4190 domain-containing protein [Glycomyces terrestris]|uniref:DUF4190 domain-containing protein n=1 Tax=Glycomyces terrestris TaxID=2493553 RepID=A0A426V0S7_9ACTN|nr:DUF4190 domain-containing protein [Glycomyces terrestris]RRS00462.1 DUF4190 domain-containing protein [Glycomyces terrestris]
MTQEYDQAGAPARLPREMNGLAIAAFVLAIVGWCSPIGILGLILGYVAKGQIARRNNSGEGLARAAIILGWISIIAFILLVVLGVAAGVFTDWDQWRDDWKDQYN